jgi:predicted transcriptional regulator
MKPKLKNVRDVMNKSIISVDKDDIIRTAVNKMVHGEIGAVIVTEKDKPVGILTERDILKFIINEKDKYVGLISQRELQRFITESR